VFGAEEQEKGRDRESEKELRDGETSGLRPKGKKIPPLYALSSFMGVSTYLIIFYSLPPYYYII
jgi:hypothetical protein